MTLTMENAHRVSVEDALLDVMDGRVLTTALRTGESPGEARVGRRHQIAESFQHKWTNMSLSEEQRSTLSAVMRGVEHEARHPAFRVEPTAYRGVSSAQAGTTGTLYFKVHGGRLVWLTFFLA